MLIQNRRQIQWTAHAKMKMRQYQLSEQRVRRVIHSPKRIEEGIAPDTIAMMSPPSIKNDKWTQEIWVMFQDKKDKRTVISTWRYPGMTKVGQPLPSEILREISGALL